MNKVTVAVAAALFAAPFLVPHNANAMSESYRRQLENSGCTQVSEAQGCNLNMTRQWNEDHGFIPREHGSRHHADRSAHHHRYEAKRREIEAFLRDSVINQDVDDARQALYDYGCERLGTDHWMKDDHEIRLTSMGGVVRSGRVH
ncbi:hypothetical protein LT875_002514 [Salmonella enterica]|nr:hypothetical protein [Salmonella enterica]